MSTGERPLFIRLSLPAGLEESLEGLAREVLRSQPKNLYKFAADHFEAKLKNRNQGEPQLQRCEKWFIDSWEKSVSCSNLTVLFVSA